MLMETDRELIERQALERLRGDIGGEIVGRRLLPLDASLCALAAEAVEPKFQEAYVVQTAPGSEHMASGGLVGKGFPSYFPREPKSVKQNYLKRRLVWRPMLPCYVFTSFEPGTERWKRIFSIAGVVRLLMYGSRPVPVPEPCMSRIRQREAEKAAKAERKLVEITVKVGEWVQIVEHHSFSGFFGQVTELLEAKQRIIVEVELFGRQTPLEVSVNQVRVV